MLLSLQSLRKFQGFLKLLYQEPGMKTKYRFLINQKITVPQTWNIQLWGPKSHEHTTKFISYVIISGAKAPSSFQPLPLSPGVPEQDILWARLASFPIAQSISTPTYPRVTSNPYTSQSPEPGQTKPHPGFAL